MGGNQPNILLPRIKKQREGSLRLNDQDHMCYTQHTKLQVLALQYKSISTDTQYVTLDNKIKCLSLAVFFFLATPPIKL